jgi:DNA recombination protein RmuC
MSLTELLLIVLVLVVLVVIALQVTVLLRGRDAGKSREDAETKLREVSSQLSYAQAQAERAGAQEQELKSAMEELSARRVDLASLSSQYESAEKSLAIAGEQIAALTVTGNALAAERSELLESHARLEQEVKSAKQREVDTSKLLADAKDEMAKEFRLLASTLLEEKGAKLNEQQKTALSDLLGPFSKTLDDFKGKVEATREADLTAREGLIAQIRHLTELNQDIGAKAQSLTNALRGESKTRGIWGETVLQRVLELAGLREGKEFRTQVSHRGEDLDGRLIPDVVLDLPQDRAIVIDAKVSLVAYERYVSANEDEAARAAALEEHAASLKRHIKDLSAKNYPSLYQLKSIDFTLLFVPIESALMAASEADPNLAQYALERHIALVSPNTLFTVLRTIEYIWRVDTTTRSMEEIVKRGGLMFDAAVRFGEHVLAIEEALGKATDATQSARKALTDPSRGLVRQAEQLRALGIKTKKTMPKKLVPDETEATLDEALLEQGLDAADLEREEDA